MTYYSKWSDAQISQKVFFWVNGSILPNGGLAHISNDKLFYFEPGGLKKPFDPCNNPADAWPIIVENRISLMFDKSTEEGDDAQWCLASSPCDQYIVDYVSESKLLRAAMIVFLMMQEKINGC